MNIWMPHGWFGPFSIWDEKTQQWIECVGCVKPEEPVCADVIVENPNETQRLDASDAFRGIE